MTTAHDAYLVAVEEARIRQAYAQREQNLSDRRASWTHPGHAYASQERERRVLAALRRLGVRLAEARVLEVGCGTGAWIREFVKWGVPPEQVWAVDLLPDSLDRARRLSAAGVNLRCCSAASLPFDDSSFDLVLQATMFSSILDPTVRRLVAAEMLRVASQNGVILWYDFHVNNPWNASVRGIGRAELRELFPGCQIELHPITLLPPLARRIAPWSHALWLFLTSMPWLCTHYLGVIRRWRSN